jgi:hypothetical protein
MHGTDAGEVVTLATLASCDCGTDLVDAAIRVAAHAAGAVAPAPVSFVPFDPATEMSAATFPDAEGAPLRVVKGAFSVMEGMCVAETDAGAAAKCYEQQGFRVLAAILTPLLRVIIMVAGDFLAMSLTTDNVRSSAHPNAWHIGKLTVVGAILAIALVGFMCGVRAIATFMLLLPMPKLQTASFVTLAFGSQALI